MKKRYMILMVLVALMLAIPMVLVAGGGDKVISAADARELENDAKVVLEGFIVEDIGDDLFLFRDDSGDIDLKTDEKAWAKAQMDVDELVRVYGRIVRVDDLVWIKVEEVKNVKDFHLDEEIEEDIEDENGEYIEEEFLD